jgi:hypothetical protein
MFSSLIQWAFIAVALLWLLAVLGSFLTMFLAMVWILLSSPPSQSQGKVLAARWLVSIDDLGEVLTSQRLLKARRVLFRSACVFLSLAVFGAAFALLKKLAG